MSFGVVRTALMLYDVMHVIVRIVRVPKITSISETLCIRDNTPHCMFLRKLLIVHFFLEGCQIKHECMWNGWIIKEQQQKAGNTMPHKLRMSCQTKKERGRANTTVSLAMSNQKALESNSQTLGTKGHICYYLSVAFVFWVKDFSARQR